VPRVSTGGKRRAGTLTAAKNKAANERKRHDALDEKVGAQTQHEELVHEGVERLERLGAGTAGRGQGGEQRRRQGAVGARAAGGREGVHGCTTTPARAEKA
jgi:hypothetical protein